jgi:hypothetical protein
VRQRLRERVAPVSLQDQHHPASGLICQNIFQPLRKCAAHVRLKMPQTAQIRVAAKGAQRGTSLAALGLHRPPLGTPGPQRRDRRLAAAHTRFVQRLAVQPHLDLSHEAPQWRGPRSARQGLGDVGSHTAGGLGGGDGSNAGSPE